MKYFTGALVSLIIVGICGWFLWPKYCIKIEPTDSKISAEETSLPEVIDESIKNELKAYPEKKGEFVRKEFYLPKRESEADYMVEIRVGRVVAVDCNVHSYMGEITEEVVSGWGYPYWVANPTEMAQTLMFCQDQEKTNQFVYLSKKIRYNSRLPVVVYAPSDAEVRYRIWSAGEKEYIQ